MVTRLIVNYHSISKTFKKLKIKVTIKDVYVIWDKMAIFVRNMIIRTDSWIKRQLKVHIQI